MVNLGCAVRNYAPLERIQMSCAAFAKKILIHRCMPLLAMVLFCTCVFAQSDAKPSQGGAESKKASTGKGKKQSASQEKKTEAGAAAAEKTSGASEGDQEEAKGPWHGLTWRLVGPFRGGRALAVSGVVGDEHTYYFGSTGGGVWKTTDGGLTWHPLTDKVKDMAPSI